MAATDEALRVGVVGTGSLGFHHARILRDLPGTRMQGFFELRTERRHEVEQELEVTAFDSLDALLDTVDAVVVAVPTLQHEEVAVAAVTRGIHVLIEKPIAPTVEAADRILAAARAGKAVVQTGHVERFNSALLAADRYLDTPLFIESHRLAPFVNRGTDVAVVLDLMIHDVDLVQSLVGTPILEIAASGVPVLTPNVDIANARLTFTGGAVANLTASRVSMERMRKLRIFQRSGYMSLNLAEGTGEFLRVKGELPALSDIAVGAPGANGGSANGHGAAEMGLLDIIERIPLEKTEGEPLRRELENFRDAALGFAAPLVTGDDGRAALDVIRSIEERIEQHVADTRTA
ncbi:MAG: Gfo/Idh/MocA family oxidoreductase [Gemmatimonadota bacterium]